jgi:ADP-heptose:LPS heptosyltransferase
MQRLGGGWEMNAGNRRRDLHRLRLGMMGFFRCIKLLLRNRRTHYVISTFGVGDALMACAYLRAYKETYHIPHVTLVGKKSMRDIFRMYEGEYDELLLMEDAQIVQLSDAFLFDFAYNLFYKWMFLITPAVIICHIKNFEMMIKRADNWFYRTTTMQDLYKAMLFMLPADAKMVRPDTTVIPDVSELAASCGAIAGKSIVLSPYAFSVEKIDSTFWEELARRLSEEGYVCFTNTFKPGEKPVGDTKAISFGLMETASFTQYCGNMIALRSGLCDLTQYMACKMAVIYPDRDVGGTRSFFGLNDHEGASEIREFTYHQTLQDKMIAEICSFFTKE